MYFQVWQTPLTLPSKGGLRRTMFCGLLSCAFLCFNFLQIRWKAKPCMRTSCHCTTVTARCLWTQRKGTLRWKQPHPRVELTPLRLCRLWGLIVVSRPLPLCPLRGLTVSLHPLPLRLIRQSLYPNPGGPTPPPPSRISPWGGLSSLLNLFHPS